VQLIVEMDSRSIPILEDIRQLTGLESYEEILNYALTVLYWTAKQRRHGRIVASLDESNGSYQTLRVIREREAAAAAAVVDIQAAAG